MLFVSTKRGVEEFAAEGLNSEVRASSGLVVGLARVDFVTAEGAPLA